MSHPVHVLSTLRAYRDLPVISGRLYLPIAMAGRLPGAMTPVAILTCVALATGDLAAAGLAATAIALGTAIGAPASGLLSDRFGQRRILGPAVLINAAALCGLALFALTAPVARLILCALIGLSLPQVGGMSRARWAALTRSRLTAAFAFEGTADELSYVAGPALAGVLATAGGPVVTLLSCAGVALCASGAFAVHPTHDAPRIAGRAAVTGSSPASSGSLGRRAGHLPPGAMLRALSVPLASASAMGVMFASVQTAVTAFCVATGRPGSGGVLYAVMAAGSTITAALVPALPAHFSSAARRLASAAGLVVGLTVMLASLTLGPVAVGAAVFITGLSVGPLLITLNDVVASRISPSQAGGAMTFLSAASVGGVAMGALAAGISARQIGAAGALLVGLSAGLALVVLALRSGSAPGLRARWRPADRSPRRLPASAAG